MKAIFRAGHLWLCIEDSLFNREYRKCPALQCTMSIVRHALIYIFDVFMSLPAKVFLAKTFRLGIKPAGGCRAVEALF